MRTKRLPSGWSAYRRRPARTSYQTQQDGGHSKGPTLNSVCLFIHSSSLHKIESLRGVDVTEGIPTRDVPARGPPTAVELLFKLHSWNRPGLTEVQFRSLFAKCRCGLITTRETFDEHDCNHSLRHSDVIDLTSDADN